MAEIDRVWQDLRALRASPVGLAANDADRRAVFSAALRQAQELADAARASGYATKPLPLFYCLSQGARAFAAAREEGDAWRLRGHGARVEPSPRLLETKIVPQPSKKASHQDVLSSIQEEADALTNPMTLAEVWQACPEGPRLPSDLGADLPGAMRLHLYPAREVRAAAAREGRIEVALEGLSPDLSDSEVADWLEHYPTLSGSQPVRALIEGNPSRERHYVTERAQVTYSRGGRMIPYRGEWVLESPVRSWPLELGEGEGDDVDAAWREALERLGPLGISKSSDRLALPSVGGSERPHFVALWWAVLLALSSVVRYEPATWTAAIDPDRSPLAVPLEQACDLSETLVPRVLHGALVDTPE